MHNTSYDRRVSVQRARASLEFPSRKSGELKRRSGEKGGFDGVEVAGAGEKDEDKPKAGEFSYDNAPKGKFPFSRLLALNPPLL